MILHSLTLSGLRCFRNPVTLADFDPGVNIIYGPNESGKSTLILGLVLAFANRYNVGGKEIAALRPWGTSLNPTVIVEFISGNRRYRLEKSFLGGARSILSEWANGRYLALAEGPEADERVRQVMLAQFSGHGLSKQQQWGLAGLLWMPQSRERLAAPVVSGEVQDRLRQALGATLFGPQADRLVMAVDARYRERFTDKKGDYKAGARVKQLEQQLTALRERLESARRAVDEVGTKAARLRECQARMAALSEEAKVLKDRRRQWEQKAGEVQELKARHQSLLAAHAVACRKWEELDREWREVTGLEAKIAALEKAGEIKGQALREAEAALRAVEGQVLAGEEAVQEIGRAVQGVEEELKRAYRLQQALQLRERIDDQSRRLQEAKALLAEMQAVERELAREPLPEPAVVQAAAKAETEIAALEAEARAAGLEINLTAYRDLTIVAAAPEGVATHTVTPAAPLLLAAADRLALEIPGVCRIEVKSGAKDLQKLLQQLGAARERLQGLLEKYKAATVAALRQRYEWAVEKRNTLASLSDQLRRSLAGEGSVDALEAELAASEQALREMCSALDLPPEKLEGVQVPEIPPLEEKLLTLRKRYAEVNGELEALREQHRELQEKAHRLSQELSSLEGERKAALSELSRRLAPYGGSTQTLQAALEAARREKEEAKQSLDRLAQRLREEEAGLAGRAELERRLQQLEAEEIPRLSEEIGALKAGIEQAGASGLYSQLALLEEEEAVLAAAYRRELRRARAIKLLFRLVHARREQMLAALAEPVEAEITALLAQATGRTDRQVELAADLSLAGLRVEAGQVVPLDAFSFGAQEQLLILVRLALGRYLATDERQLVVLDDALVNTDATRRSRLLSLLAAAAADLQLIILTCHPESYAGLPGKRFNLEELARA